MEVKEYIEVGMSKEATFEVEERYTAANIGSGSLAVLATPSMIGFMEQVGRDLLAQHLPQGYSSVGMHVDVRHLAPTPVGAQVRVRCEVTAIDGRRVDFTVLAWDTVEAIGEGQHQRVVIEEARFAQRVQAKASG
ncbi:MAG: thioesterase family protein [Chloroflexota bacterium]